MLLYLGKLCFCRCLYDVWMSIEAKEITTCYCCVLLWNRPEFRLQIWVNNIYRLKKKIFEKLLELFIPLIQYVTKENIYSFQQIKM